MDNNQKQQLIEVNVWLDRLYQVAEIVISENNLRGISPFEIIALLNVRLHMQDTFPDSLVQLEEEKKSKPNIFLLKPKNQEPTQ